MAERTGFTHESFVSESAEWYTPPEVFTAIGLRFDLDPCSPGPGKSFVPADQHYTIDDDGLTSPWHGTVFVNPPYGQQTGAWMRKLADHGDGIGLVFARTEVRWFHDVADRADLVCFMKNRLRFYRGNLTDHGKDAGTGSMLIAFGQKSATALSTSGLGMCFKRTTMGQAA